MKSREDSNLHKRASRKVLSLRSCFIVILVFLTACSSDGALAIQEDLEASAATAEGTPTEIPSATVQASETFTPTIPTATITASPTLSMDAGAIAFAEETGVSISATNNPKYPVIAVSNTGEILLPIANEQENGVIELAGASIFGPNGETFSVFIDADNQKVIAVSDGTILLFENERENLVDIVEIAADGSQHYYFDVEFDGESEPVSQESGPAAKFRAIPAMQEENETLRLAKEAQRLLKTYSCPVALAITAATAGGGAIGASIACAGLIIDVIGNYIDDPSIQWAGLSTDVIDCFNVLGGGVGPMDCVELYLSIYIDASEANQEEVANNEEGINQANQALLSAREDYEQSLGQSLSGAFGTCFESRSEEEATEESGGSFLDDGVVEEGIACDPESGAISTSVFLFGKSQGNVLDSEDHSSNLVSGLESSFVPDFSGTASIKVELEVNSKTAAAAGSGVAIPQFATILSAYADYQVISDFDPLVDSFIFVTSSYVWTDAFVSVEDAEGRLSEERERISDQKASFPAGTSATVDILEERPFTVELEVPVVQGEEYTMRVGLETRAAVQGWSFVFWNPRRELNTQIISITISQIGE